MFLGSHFAAPIMGALLLESRGKKKNLSHAITKEEYLVLGLIGMMPDMLYPHFGGGSHYQSFTHSLWAFGLFTGAILLIGKTVYKNLSNRYIVYMILALSSHYLIDFFSGGVLWLYPFSESKIGYALIPLKTWVILDFTLIITMLLMMKYRNRMKFIYKKKHHENLREK